ncbi:hypothetical protein GCM10020331_049730 [Ectobacillus funiculus]
MSVSELKEEQGMLQKRGMLHTACFSSRIFLLFFIAIGFGTSLVGKFFMDYQNLIRQLGAIFLSFLFGLVIVGVFKPEFF